MLSPTSLSCLLVLIFLRSQNLWAQDFPGENWPTSTPEAEGVDPSVIEAIHHDIESGEYGLVDHFLLIRHGKIIADYRYENDYAAIAAEYDTTNYIYNYDHPAWHPFLNGSKLHTLQSVTKSVTSAALGIAIDRGLLSGPDAPVMPLLSDYAPDLSDPRRTDLVLEDLLTMRSGIAWYTGGGYSNTEHSTIKMELSDAWVPFILDQPMDRDPGTVFQYNDGASVLIGQILREATGKRADLWAEAELFEPIGIDNYYWKITPDGETDTEGGLYLEPHDLARIGYLFLHDGMWGDRRILSEDWVQKSTAPILPDIQPNNDRFDPGYGYQWWITGLDGDETSVFAANGYGGQFLMVSPEHDMIVVFNGWNIHGGASKSTYRALQGRILPATELDR